MKKISGQRKLHQQLETYLKVSTCSTCSKIQFSSLNSDNLARLEKMFHFPFALNHHYHSADVAFVVQITIT